MEKIFSCGVVWVMVLKVRFIISSVVIVGSVSSSVVFII